jgi:alanyl-tRNA synthetase
VLGSEAHQAGSLVAPDRLRFDYTAPKVPSAEDLARVESLVNEQILAALPVSTSEMSLDEARAIGAMALFGEKYGERVRVVRMGDWSMELCGGTHVRNTSEIGLFKLIADAGIGSGVRRVEAVTGEGVLAYMAQRDQLLGETAVALRTRPEEVAARAAELAAELAARERELAKLAASQLHSAGQALLQRAEPLLNGSRLVVGQVPAPDMEGLRQLADELRRGLGSGAVVLGAAHEGRVMLLCALTPDLPPRGLHAGKAVSAAAAVVGGGGGGRPDMAQAGGKDPSRLPEALETGARILRAQVPA